MHSILRFATAGSVDDGKSSLIGRLLYDSKSIFEDQLEAIEKASARRGAAQVELALLTDGLRAEREQNITIDVAYRYFGTPKRKFIIADTPGHFQYTRNMVTGTSTVDLSVILVDARKGILPQSKRHAAVSALLGVPEVLIAVNKMDLVEFSQARFEEIAGEFGEALKKLGVRRATFVPISALLGDNVVEASPNMPWYEGPTLLAFLEEVEIPPLTAQATFRLPVQVVIRPDQDYRGLAGRVEAGSIGVGDPVLVLPNGRATTIGSIRGPDGTLERADEGIPAVVTLAEEIDVGRGDMLVDPISPPTVSDRFEAVVCWMDEDEAQPGRRYILLHATRRVFAHIEDVTGRLDIETLDSHEARTLGLNDLGQITLRTSQPIFADLYAQNHATGSFVLVDPGTNRTVAAGMICSFAPPTTRSKSDGLVLWLATQSEGLADEVAREVRGRGFHTLLLDEVTLRSGINADSPSHGETIRRILAVATLAKEQGFVVIVAAGLDDDERAGISRSLGHDVAFADEGDAPSIAEHVFGGVGGL